MGDPYQKDDLYVRHFSSRAPTVRMYDARRNLPTSSAGYTTQFDDTQFKSSIEPEQRYHEQVGQKQATVECQIRCRRLKMRR